MPEITAPNQSRAIGLTVESRIHPTFFALGNIGLSRTNGLVP